jgi:hypothetical protein
LFAGRQEGGEANQPEKPAQRRIEQNPHTLSQFVTGSFSQTEIDCVPRFVKVSGHLKLAHGAATAEQFLWQKHHPVRKNTFISSATKRPTATAA